MARRRVSNIEQSLRILLAGLGGFLLTFCIVAAIDPGDDPERGCCRWVDRGLCPGGSCFAPHLIEKNPTHRSSAPPRGGPPLPGSLLTLIFRL